jgi:hypothetical protein
LIIFLKTLDHILQFHHKNNIEFVICGDINVDYLENNRKRAKLNHMLKTYNLTSTVYFPTRTTNISTTLIDNIFINYTRNYNVNLCANGLSDHDAQLITINGITITKGSIRSVNIREINKESIKEFQFLLSWEQWEDIFDNEDVNNMFNNFLNTYLRCFYASFPIRTKKANSNQSTWITKGIRTSCKRKRQLILYCRYNNDVNTKRYLRQYSKILTRVITEAKKIILR